MFTKLTKEQLKSKIGFIKEYVTSGKNASTSSKLDSNANVHMKNVATLQAEIYKDFNIQLKREMIKEIMTVNFGDDLVESFENDLKEHLIYIHDETGTLGAPYCAAIKLDPLMESGLRTLGGESKAPTHLRSFAGSYVNALFAMSSQFNGAIATTQVLAYIDLLARKDFGDNYLETNRNDIEQELQHIIYALNQPAAARNFQSVFFNWSILDEAYFNGLFEHYTTPSGEKFSWNSLSKLQHFFMDWFNKERLHATLTFPVVTASFFTKDGKIVDKEYEEMAVKELVRGNSFFLYMSDDVDSLSSCCRLRSKLTKEFALTTGNIGVDTGSQQVITINMNRLVQKYVGNLRSIVERVQKYLVCYHKFYDWFLQNEMLTVYDAGYITMKKQYLTIGLNGVLEGAEFLGMKPNNNPEYLNYLKDTMRLLKESNAEAGAKYDLMFNTEFVPAEGLGPKFYAWDKKDGLMVNHGRNSYNSYFYAVEDAEINIIDKLHLYAKEVTENLDGGSAIHINLDEHLDIEGYRKILHMMADLGVPYVGFNVPTTVCNECGTRDKRFLETCPKCGSKNLDWETRVIGYLKKVSHFSEARQVEAGNRHYHLK